MVIMQHQGLIPRQQQDALLAMAQVRQMNNMTPRQLTITPKSGLCAVADGVAASFKPQLASRALLEILCKAQQDAANQLQDGWLGPRALRRFAHPRLCRQLATSTAYRSSATTLAMLQWRDGLFSALNVGDSRIYCIATEGTWRQVSLDHTYYQSMLQQGEIAPGDDLGQLYHDLEHMISADEAEDDFAIHWETGAWPSGATWLLCSDGLHDTLDQQTLQALFDVEKPLMDLAGHLRVGLLQAGAPDNFSVILLR